MTDFNQQIIDEFRANGGKVAMFGDAPLVILHTVGAKSGQIREVPLVSLIQGGSEYVFASKGGAPTNPDWYFNLLAQPEIDVEAPGRTYRARLVELPVEEGQARLADQAALHPQFGEYVVNAAPRKIPVFRIDEI